MSGFFTKIAHSPHVNLGDFKQLHEVLTSERRTIDSTQKLAGDQARASNAIRDWGNLEGDDLGDVLAKVAHLYDYQAQAELAYAEHCTQYRLKFKEIRTMEENLSSLRRSRDQQGGKIDAQERKVAKMKEEHKDLPAAKQRLRELRDEMIGLENSVLTEDSRLGDFKRSAIREGLSLKLGALLELSEKTTIIAELGKLMVDELPIERTQPGEPRPHYEGYERTSYLLQEAQRCLQGVTFNPAPISEPFGADTGDSATEHAGQYAEEPLAQSPDFHQEEQPTGHHQPQQQYGSMASFQTQPSSAFAQQGSASGSQYLNSPRTSIAGSQSGVTAYANDRATSGNDHLTLTSPQLNPLPDFKRLSFGGPAPRAEESSRQASAPLAPPLGSLSTVLGSPVSGYQSNTPALSAPEEGWGTNRTSLAYLGEAPSSDGGHGDIEAREAREAREDESAARNGDEGHEQRNGQTSRNYAGGAITKPDEGLPTISETMLETSPAIPQTPIVPIPSPDVPSDVQPQSRTDSSSPEPVSARAAEPASPRQREYQPLLDPLIPPRETKSPVASIERPSVNAPTSTTAAVPPPPPSVAISSPRPNSIVVHAPAPEPLPLPSPLPIASPTNPSINQFVPAPTSGFEPRPIAARALSGTPRQPISIKPLGGNGNGGLGSKHGDIVVTSPGSTSQFAPSAPSPSLRASGNGNPVYGDATPASSGYFTPVGNASGPPTTPIDGKRTISAGAFRRPVGAGTSSSVGGINVNGGRSFAPSGYNVGPGSPGFGPSPGAGPSDAEEIARTWRSSATPVGSQPPLDGYNTSGGPPADDVATPNFDTRPLQVNKNRMSMSGLGRPGTVPPTLSSAPPRSASGPIPSQAYDDARTYETGSNGSHASPSYHSFAPPHPPYQAHAGATPRTPTSPTGSAGFGSNRFVTRLD
ncbi:uncharacterized protein JCM15063_000559 [Sporobolomyces koalae]|uniref:uncharacterized protein n=1 Tax=Sporobolomyces koalae TaxID=500713 RepID=UPI00316D0B0F